MIATIVMQTSVSATANGGAQSDIPVNLTPWRMFLEADSFVQAVMLLLLLASVLSWATLIAKSRELAAAKKALGEDQAKLDRARSTDGIAPARYKPVAAMVEAARAEQARPDDAVGGSERLSIRLDRIERAAIQRMMRGVNWLGTIGSTGPFVGLLGTVWGIMNAFMGIAETQTTSLAVVAPGIAEALLATATGLVAAIPAVVIYNVLARSIADYRRMLGDASAAVTLLANGPGRADGPAPGTAR